MADIYHTNARTTRKIREEIRDSKESIAAIAQHYDLNEKTVLKWRKAGRVTDAKSGPKQPRSVLTQQEEQVICEFRRQTQFSLDDVFIALKDRIPALSRSNLHRCLTRHGLSTLPRDESTPREKKKFTEYPVGYVHVDITTLLLEGGQKYYLFVGICRVSKYAYIELHDNQKTETSCGFLRNLITDCPFKIHRLLTDNGSQFTYALLAEHLRPKEKIHPFDDLCQQHNIKHKLTQFRHPWTNGQVEVFNKSIKNHTTKKYHYENIKQLKQHLMAYLLVHNFQKKLKSLKYQTPYDFLLQSYANTPQYFNTNTHYKIVGLNN